MRVQEAIVRQLQQVTTATYAITSVGPKSVARDGANFIFWAILAKNPELPFVRVRKSAHEPQLKGFVARRLPANATIEIVGYAKSQDAAADLMDAVTADLVPFTGLMPNTSPPTSGAITVSQVEVGTEEDLVSEESLERNIFAEAREFVVRYDQR